MKPVIPDLFKKYKPYEYGKEFERIDFEIDCMDDVDFTILINTDIVFRATFMQRFRFRRPFSDLLQLTINIQKQEYKRYLYNIYQFPYFSFQRN